MEINNGLKFAEHVILLDATFLTEMLGGIRGQMSTELGRDLPPFDVVSWLTCLALDAGIRGEEKEWSVLLVHEQGQQMLSGCTPESLKEYDGQACRTVIGELAFFPMSGEGMVTNTELYVDLLGLLMRDDAVKELLLVPPMGVNGVKVEEALQAAYDAEKEKQVRVTWFGMEQPQLSEEMCKWIPVSYSLAYAWGIRSDELRNE